MLCHVGKRLGGVGPQPRELTQTGHWDINSIPCDTMMSILSGAVVQCCVVVVVAWGVVLLGLLGWWWVMSSCVMWCLFWLLIPPSPCSGFCRSCDYPFHCILVVVLF